MKLLQTHRLLVLVAMLASTSACPGPTAQKPGPPPKETPGFEQCQVMLLTQRGCPPDDCGVFLQLDSSVPVEIASGVIVIHDKLPAASGSQIVGRHLPIVGPQAGELIIMDYNESLSDPYLASGLPGSAPGLEQWYKVACTKAIHVTR